MRLQQLQRASSSPFSQSTITTGVLLLLLVAAILPQRAAAASLQQRHHCSVPAFVPPQQHQQQRQQTLRPTARAFGPNRRRLPLLLMASSSSTSSSSSSPSASTPPAPSPSTKRVYAYAHGFLSDERSYKGQHFAKVMAEKWGQQLHLLNLNRPTGNPEGITYRGGLDAIDVLYEAEGGEKDGVKLTLFGSSLGGFLAARYAELHPQRVEKLVLLCPGFDRCSRWERVFGLAALQEWAAQGYREFEFKGRPVFVPYAFVTEAQEHPPFPRYRCPALIIHGSQDDVVPVDVSTQALFAALPGIEEHTAVLVVEDDHGLTKADTLKSAEKAIGDFLELRRGEEGASRPADSSRSMIEVEQKFALALNDPAARAALEDAIRAQGGVFKAQVIMTDTYYDLPGEALSTANVWLRSRSGVWELKVPAVEGEHPNVHAVACYREIMGADDCRRWLLQRFPERFALHRTTTDLFALLNATGARPMARYTTHRAKYAVTLEDTAMNVDVDEADFGFGVVEIEECVSRDEDVEAAKARVTRLARMLGLCDGGEGQAGKVVRGKLEEYLFRKDPLHHARLVAAGVFKA